MLDPKKLLTQFYISSNIGIRNTKQGEVVAEKKPQGEGRSLIMSFGSLFLERIILRSAAK